jgi:hypothetical protein
MFSIPTDKLLHAFAGAVVMALAMSALSLGQAFGVLLGAAAAKEVYDFGANLYATMRHYPETHDVDPIDFLATVAGGWLFMVASALLRMAMAGGAQ